MKVIGDKSKIAVEYKITDQKNMMGYGKLWVENRFYGTNQDFIFIDGYLGGVLIDLLRTSELDYDPSLSNEQLYMLLRDSLEINSKYLLSSSTFTDDFLCFKFSNRNTTTLVWKMLNTNQTVFTDLFNYPSEAQVGKFKTDDLINVLNLFNRDINNSKVL